VVGGNDNGNDNVSGNNIDNDNDVDNYVDKKEEADISTKRNYYSKGCVGCKWLDA